MRQTVVRNSGVFLDLQGELNKGNIDYSDLCVFGINLPENAGAGDRRLGTQVSAFKSQQRRRHNDVS